MKRSRVSKPQFSTTTAIFIAVAAVAAFAIILATRHSAPWTPDRNDGEEFCRQVDVEFSDFIGEGHKIDQYGYVDFTLAHVNTDVGYGPLYSFYEHQIIVGKTGRIGAIAYMIDGQPSKLYPTPQDNSSLFIVVFNDCIAPEAWWDHPLTHGTFRDNDTGNIAYVVTPWDDDEDFDNPSSDPADQKYPWYWNGHNYVEMTPDVAHVEKKPHSATGYST